MTEPHARLPRAPRVRERGAELLYSGMAPPPATTSDPAMLARLPHEEAFGSRLRVARWGTLLALLTILFGFALGGVFGAFERPLKEGLAARAAAVADPIYGGDAAKMKAVVDKSWSYYKRAHMHGGGIGAVALGGILLLAGLHRPSRRARQGVSLALGLGGLGYASFWLLAARAAPSVGSTDAAKEALSWLAVPSAGLLVLGMVAVIALTAIELFAAPALRAR